MPKSNQQESATAHPGQREAFATIEARAREVLRERGFSEEQIDHELQRKRRSELGRPS